MKTEKAKKENISVHNRASKVNNKKLWNLRGRCWKNTIRFLKDAKILLKNKRYESSFFMSYTGLEELGKYLFICDYITDIVSEKEFKDSFSDHKLKIAYLHNNAALTKNENGSYDATLVYEKSIFHDWFIKRNNSLYIDIDDELNCLTPSEQISEEDAVKMYERLEVQFYHINQCEIMNERIGSKAIYK